MNAEFDKVWEWVHLKDMTMECFYSLPDVIKYKIDDKYNGYTVYVGFKLNDTGYTWYPEDLCDTNYAQDYEITKNEEEKIYEIYVEC